jgi:hypothetical protein
MIACIATSSVSTDMSKPRGPGRPKKTDPYAAELRGGTIHPVVQQLCAWRLRHGLSQKQTVDLLRSYNFALTPSALRDWEEGRRTPRVHTAEILGHLLKKLPSTTGTS